MSEPQHVPPPAPVPAPGPAVPAPMPAYGGHASPYATPAPAPWGPQGWRPPLPSAPLGLGTAVIVLAGVWTGLQLLSLATSFEAADRLAAADAAGTIAPFTTYDFVGFLTFPVQIAAYVVVCLWLQGSRTFSEVAAPMVRQPRGPAWLWLGWIVPVVSFWFPYQVVRDVAGETGARLRITLGWWWACWLAAMWLTNQSVIAGSGLGSRDPSTLPAFEALVTAALVGAFVLWVRIVRAVTAWQKGHLASIG
ncbi:DUF4328 domain-containing protein [Xylanimonas protaetiae]|uniref:DUF4328 domain-containing protein n=1 Tax=Xylanimonas protaetiae TaxID=2509457 RepID=A0A4P6F8E9_9MICO|nr:DUF4328 domain-containing protein [Xylanimonas protaetiae]QAY70589.1 DUF4328 domain-containing protein [Xylanimonas protaetiae]